MAGGKKRKDASKKSETKAETNGSSFSVKDAVQFVEKVVKSRWFTIALVLIPLILALFFRLYPAWLPITDDWAEQSIDNQIRSQAAQQVRAQYPLLPANEVNAQASEQVAQFKADNQEQYESQRNQLSEQFKARLQTTIGEGEDSYEQTYLLAIDPYYYLRRAENVAESGNVCDVVEDGRCIDDHMTAPNSRETTNDYHSLLAGLLIVIFGAFGLGSLTAVFYMPAIISALSTIPAFFIVRRRFDDFGGLIAALVVGLHTTFLGRTPAGFADTDAYNVFFPLYIAWLLLIGLDRKDKWGYLSIGGAGLLTALYSKFWGGWYFTFVILSLVLVGTAAYAGIRYLLSLHGKFLKGTDSKAMKSYAARAISDLGIYVGVTAVITTILSGWQRFISGVLAPLNVSVGLQDPVGNQLWPNVLTTVAELNTVNLNNIIGQAGGRLFFIIAIIGVFSYAFKDNDKDWRYWSALGGLIIYYFFMTGPTALGMGVFTYLALFALPLVGTFVYSVLRKENIAIHYGLFLMGWFVATIFATTQGARFLLLLVPIMGLTVGFAAAWLKDLAVLLLEKEMNVPPFWGSLVMIVLGLTLLLAPVGANMIQDAHRVGMSEVPSMNDAWWNSLEAIQQDSQPEAIITSWWDFGHWFKYVADRPVTFDGASQKGEQAHLVGRLFQTDDEQESLGILRMLHCGGENAFYSIQESVEDPLESYRILKSIIVVDRETAKSLLMDAGLSGEQVDTTLSQTHCRPAGSYVIVSQDMVGKAGVWGHFGLWSMERSFVYETSKEHGRAEAVPIIAEGLGVSEQEAQSLHTAVTSQTSRQAVNTWISPWPQLGGSSSCNRQNESITCGIGVGLGRQQGVSLSARNLVIDTSNVSSAYMQIVGGGQALGRITPSTLFIDGERYDLGGDFPLAISITGNSAIIANNQLVNSMFAQWFYYEEPGPYLETLTRQIQVNGQKIIVYRVNWDAFINSLTETLNSPEDSE